MADATPPPNDLVFSAAEGLRWQEMDHDEYLVFNPLSDEIHRLNPMAAAILSEIETQALNPETLSRRLASLTGIRQNQNSCTELDAQLREILLQFDELGLVLIQQRATTTP